MVVDTVPDEVLDSLHTDLKQVLSFLKYSDNPEKMKVLLLKEEDSFNSLSRDAAMLLKELTDTKFEIPQARNGGKVQMCKAIEQMIEDAKKETAERVERETAERVEKETTERVAKEISEKLHIDLDSIKELLS